MKKTTLTVRPIFVTLILILLLTDNAKAAFKPDQIYRSNRLDISVDTQFYKTTANFNSSGSKTDLVNDNYYQIIDVTPQIRYGLTQSLGVRLGGNVGNAQSSDIVANRSNSTFNRLDVGGDFLFLEFGSLQTIFDFEYSHALEKVDANTDSALNGSATSDIKPTFILRMNMESFYPYANIGANFRSDGQSNLLTYGGGGEFRFQEFGLGAEVQGFTSISDDKYTNQAFRRDNVTLKVNGGSKRFYSINPSLLTGKLFLNFPVSKTFFIKLYGGYDFVGSNMSQGFLAGGSIAVSFDDLFKSSAKSTPSRSSRITPTDRSTTKPQPRTQGFREDTNDGVNQEYFKTIKPSQDNYIQNVEESGEDEEGMSTTVKRKDDKGYTIKLKQIKKKPKKK